MMREIRKMNKSDIDGVMKLLYQVNQVHADARPDLFKSGGIKYTREDLLEKVDREDEIIFVLTEEDDVKGYIFGQFEETIESNSVYGKKTFYIDDLCVDENMRRMHVATDLYNYVRDYAKDKGFDRITLHVWEGNPGAKKFYEDMGMKPMYIAMEDSL